MNENTFGELLQKLRGDKTLREISAISNISHAYLSILEKGYNPQTKKEIKPSVEIIKKLSEIYLYPFEELMQAAGYTENPEQKNTPSLKTQRLVRVLARAEKLPDEEIDSLAEVLEVLISKHEKQIQKEK